MDEKQKSELFRNEQLIKTQQERINRLVEIQEELKEQFKLSPKKQQEFMKTTGNKVNLLENLVKQIIEDDQLNRSVISNHNFKETDSTPAAINELLLSRSQCKQFEGSGEIIQEEMVETSKSDVSQSPCSQIVNVAEIDKVDLNALVSSIV